ncbi:MAG: LbtU family siderophore porin [Thermodesulfobacteriota bacterium]
MKKILIFLSAVFISTVFFTTSLFSQELSNAELSEKISDLEKKIEHPFFTEKIEFSGEIEFEAGYEKQDNETSDFSTATVDFGATAEINEYITGSFVFTFNDEDKDIELDEALISAGAQNSPLYADFGYYVLPFGVYNTGFISDPLTLEIGEITENAITAGFFNDIFSFSASVFNGDVNKSGDDDHISKYVVAGSVNLPENEIAAVSFGGSYISDISDSDGLEGQFQETGVNDFTSGWSVYLNADIKGKIFFDAEYTGAADDIESGTDKIKPEAYNIEIGFAPLENIETAARYENGEDIEINERYGAVGSWTVLENTCVAVEYLRSSFKDSTKDDADTFTAQLAVQF